MGRAGIEPATLGLKVRTNEPKRAPSSCEMLQRVRFAAAPDCSEMHVIETSLYAHPYARFSSGQTTLLLHGKGRRPPLYEECVRQASSVAPWTYNFAYVGMPVKVIAKS